MKNFKPNPNGTNELLRIDDLCYISFNPSPCEGISFFEADGKSCETALCIGGSYYILNGDFREQYTKAANSFDPFTACVNVYQNNKVKFNSTWSSDIDIFELLKCRLN